MNSKSLYTRAVKDQIGMMSYQIDKIKIQTNNQKPTDKYVKKQIYQLETDLQQTSIEIDKFQNASNINWFLLTTCLESRLQNTQRNLNQITELTQIY